MQTRLIKILKIVLPLGIGIYLTWYFLSGLSSKDIEDTQKAFVEANYFWVLLSIIVAVLSHLSRAHRWRYQLETMGYNVSLWNAFHSVMAGYVINYTVPRSGEVARAGFLSSYENVPFEKGFATIVVERLIDVLMLGIVVFISGILQTNSEEFSKIMVKQNGEGSNWIIWLVLGIGFVIALIGLVFYRLNEKFKSFVNDKKAGFWEGLKTVWTMKKKWSYLGHTIFIWSCYVGMVWMGAQVFEQTADMPIACVFGAFVVGAAAIALLPGGLGVYPLWVTSALLIYEIDFPAFGIFIWVIQTVLIVGLGLTSLFLIQRQPKIETTDNGK